MRSAFVVAAALALVSSVGCQQQNLRGGCSSCGLAGGGDTGGDVALAGFMGRASGSCSSCSDGGCASCAADASHAAGGCASCGGAGCAGCGRQGRPAYVGHVPHGYLQAQGPPGPPSASFAYPYYTTRAPRDFLSPNPPSIGP